MCRGLAWLLECMESAGGCKGPCCVWDVVGRSSSCQPTHMAEQLSTDDVVTWCPSFGLVSLQLCASITC